ncbi:MAG: hypothetical protein EAZ89_19065 [Bacteroidetes bacterium]|nr:MAG: hypothetical protein EAZ89_19065 [Bacteroidota bacterium]
MFLPCLLPAQKVEYKDGLVTVDKLPVAKISSEKSALPLVRDYKATNMAGKLLFTAVYSDRIPEDPNNNTVFYYEFRFEGRTAPAYLPVSKLGAEKSIANLIGNFGLVVKDSLSLKAVQALVDKKGKTPVYRADYTQAARNRQFPIELKEAGKLTQAGVLISTFTDLGNQGGLDVYNFFLPNGTLAATVRFSGGNAATSMEVKNYATGATLTAPLAGEKTTQIAATDRNYFTIKRVAAWLVANNLL